MTVSMAGFAVEDAFLKHAAGAVPVGMVMALMGLFGMAVFAMQARRAGHAPLTRAALTPMMGLRSLCEIIGRVFFALALTLTPISSASAILQATPLLVVLGAAAIFGERVGARRWGLIILGFVGVLIIIRPGAGDFNALSLLAVAAMAGFAGRDLATRAAPPALSNAQLGVTGFLMLLISGLILIALRAPMPLPAITDLPPILGAAIFAVIGYGALTVAMRTGDVAAVTPLRYSRLIFALILGRAVFGEHPLPTTLLGAAIIVGCGIALMLRKR